MVFLVISQAAGLSPDDQAWFVGNGVGPDYAAADPGYRELLRSSGFVSIVIEDVSQEYLTISRALIAARDGEREALEELWGAASFADRQRSQRMAADAIAEGRLRRYLIAARKPAAESDGC
jgi:hypothetical protein